MSARPSRLAPPLLVVLAAACGTVSWDERPLPHGNPPGYRVHVLTADSLDAKSVFLNGLTLDTSSVSAIAGSVDAILRSTDAPSVVREADGTPDLNVDFTTEAPRVSDVFYGANLQWFSRGFVTSPKYRELVRHLHVDILRFPGGQERMRYDRHARTSPDDVLGTDQPYQFVLTGEDVANYIDLCRELGIAAEPELNLYVDDAAMWADLVDQITNELGYDLRYVSVGNESEVNSNSAWSFLGATNKREAIASYMARYLRYRPAIDKVKPGITYALGETGEWGSEFGDEYLNRLGGDQPGALSAHWYMLGDYRQDSSWPDYPSIAHLLLLHSDGVHDIATLGKIAATMKAEVEYHGLHQPKLFMGEWGPAWSSSAASGRIQDRMATAIFVAEVNEYAKTLGFDSLQYFPISDPASFSPGWNPALVAVDGETMTVRPQYYVYLIYKYLYGDRIVPVPGGQNDEWSVYAARDDSHSYLMLINRSGATTHTRLLEARTDSGVRRLRLTLHPHAIAVVRF